MSQLFQLPGSGAAPTASFGDSDDEVVGVVDVDGADVVVCVAASTSN